LDAASLANPFPRIRKRVCCSRYADRLDTTLITIMCQPRRRSAFCNENVRLLRKLRGQSHGSSGRSNNSNNNNCIWNIQRVTSRNISLFFNCSLLCFSFCEFLVLLVTVPKFGRWSLLQASTTIQRVYLPAGLRSAFPSWPLIHSLIIHGRKPSRRNAELSQSIFLQVLPASPILC
jgi:hypothetical protein